jgi:hypothetical protein
MDLVFKPIDLTQVMLAAVTVLGGGFFAWLNGKKVASVDAAEKRISEHAELAQTSAAVAAKHADVAGQVVQSLRAPAMPPGMQAVLESYQGKNVQSLPPEVLESEPPASSGPTSMRIPANRPTPKDRGTR